MEPDNGFFPLQRSILKHRYMTDDGKFRFWVWRLLKASHANHKVLVGNHIAILEPEI